MLLYSTTSLIQYFTASCLDHSFSARVASVLCLDFYTILRLIANGVYALSLGCFISRYALGLASHFIQMAAKMRPLSQLPHRKYHLNQPTVSS